MSAIAGRTVGAAGDVMLIHAAGFHAVQAVPLVALLLGSRMSSMADSLRLIHAAGIGWLLLCAGLFMQALQGHHPATPTPALAISLTGVVVWLGATVLALLTRARRRRLSEG